MVWREGGENGKRKRKECACSIHVRNRGPSKHHTAPVRVGCSTSLPKQSVGIRACNSIETMAYLSSSFIPALQATTPRKMPKATKAPGGGRAPNLTAHSTHAGVTTAAPGPSTPGSGSFGATTACVTIASIPNCKCNLRGDISSDKRVPVAGKGGLGDHEDQRASRRAGEKLW